MIFMVRKNNIYYYNLSDNVEWHWKYLNCWIQEQLIINYKIYIPNHVFYLVNPSFIVPRNTLIDTINKQIVPFKATLLNNRLVLVYVDIRTQDTDNVGHELPFQILYLAKKRPKKVNNSLYIWFCIIKLIHRFIKHWILWIWNYLLSRFNMYMYRKCAC